MLPRTGTDSNRGRAERHPEGTSDQCRIRASASALLLLYFASAGGGTAGWIAGRTRSSTMVGLYYTEMKKYRENVLK